MNYLTALTIVHTGMGPRSYVEIGCRRGISLALARCPALAIDPDFEIQVSLTAPTRIFRSTSDAFFASHDLADMLGGPFDLAFIDGMHHAEFALRDFINLERYSHPGSVIVLDDVLPADIAWTTRRRETQAWTGDVYKLIPLLRDERPDLAIDVFDVEMKGFTVIANLNARDRRLADKRAALEAHLAGDNAALPSIPAIRDALRPRPVDELAGHVAALAAAAPHPQRASPAQPYLDLLKRSLLNEIYLDDELRLLYLRDCLAGKEQFDYPTYHDIRRTRAGAFAELQERRRLGQFPERNIHRSGFNHTMMGRARLDSLHTCLDRLQAAGIDGNVMECGVWRGGGCIFMAGYLKVHHMDGRRVIVADSFEGLPESTLAQDAGLHLAKDRFPELAVSLDTVRDNFAAYGLLEENVVFLKGWFRDTLPTAPVGELALLRLDGDLYESTWDALASLYDKVVPGGIVIVDDWGVIEACRQAVQGFFAARHEQVPPVTQIDWTGVYFEKPGR